MDGFDSGNTQNPQVECLLDGVAIGIPPLEMPSPINEGPFNNQIFCRNRGSSINQGQLVPPASEHVLQIIVTNSLESSISWFFDYITFESQIDPVLDGEMLQAGNSDVVNNSLTDYSMLTFGPGWTVEDSQPPVANSSSCNLTIRFNGELFVA